LASTSPDRAVVFFFDQKNRCQALDRTQPSLPMIRGRAGTMTHDYRRDGTTDLFAALNIAAGEVIAACRKQHAAAAVLAFFKTIDRSVPGSQDIHVVLENLSAHEAPEIPDWLAHPRRARWHLRVTPPRAHGSTSCSDGSRNPPVSGCAGAPSPACPSSSKPSRRGSGAATRTQSHSSGKPQLAKSPRESAEDEGPCHKSNQRRSTRGRTGRRGQY